MQLTLPIPRMTRLRRFAAALRGCTNGMALTEFAVSLPVLLTLGLVGLETANLAMAHLRVSSIAVTTADNAARVRDRIDEADVIELMTGGKMAGASLSFGQNGRIVLSSVEVNPAATGQWIRWQRCDGARNYSSRYGTEGTGQNDASLPAVGPTGNRIAAQPNTAVMLVEVSYAYQPIVPNSFLQGREIRYESAFNVRQRVNQAISNNSSNTPKSCTTFQA